MKQFKTKAAHVRYVARKHRTWTYQQIADECGCTVSSVSRALNAVGRPHSVFAIGRAVRDLGLSLDDLRTFAKQRDARA